MKKTILFVLALALVLTLVGSVATGGIVFLDDFDDGIATDGAPVTWTPLPGGRGSFDVMDGDFVMTRPSDNEEMYFSVNQYTLADTSIRTQARLIGSGGWWIGLLARGNATRGAAGGTSYIVMLFNNGRLEIWRFGPSFWRLAGADVGIDPRAQDVLLRFDVVGNELSAWAWREGDPMPVEPQVTTVHSEWATGVVGIAADLGWQLSYCDAIFRYVEVYEPTPPIPDFNGDCVIEIEDLIILIESWKKTDPSCDIAPPPFGDGIVDVLDLEVLMSYWGQEVDDPTLIAHWALDETEGDIAQDSAGDNDASVVGDPLWLPSGGQVDGALEFDGIDDYLSTPFVLDPAQGDFTILAWIKGGAPGQVIMSQQVVSDWLTLGAEGKLATELKGFGRSSALLSSDTIITDGQWHRIGLGWDGSRRTLYADGLAIGTDTRDGLEASYRGCYIGAGSGLEQGTFFSGLIDDIRIYNRAVEP